MSLWRLVAVMAGVLLAVPSGVVAAQSAVEKAEAEITATRDAFWAAHGKGDTKALASFLTEDARLLAPGMDDVRDKRGALGALLSFRPEGPGAA